MIENNKNNRLSSLLRGVALGVVAVSLFSFAASSAKAELLEEAMAEAYATNPTLQSVRAALRATDEQMSLARSGYRPNITARGTADAQYNDTNPGGDDSQYPVAASVSVTQPLYRGGRTTAAVEQARNLIYSQRADLLSSEQDTLLAVAEAYLDVVRDTAVLGLNRNNESVLERQLEASQDRFRVGEITRTDVSQSEARLSDATAQRIGAEAQLQNRIATYINVVGHEPVDLYQPTITAKLPETLDEVTETALQNNPTIIRAEYAHQAAMSSVDQIEGELYPEVNLIGTLSHTLDPIDGIDSRTSGSVRAQLDVPLYQSGSVSSRVRAARQTAAQRSLEVEVARRSVTALSIQAWENYVSSLATIEARQAQVTANEVALDGVRQETTVGSRTVLDLLNAEQELLDSNVVLVGAERDALLAGFQLLSATGRLTALDLELDVVDYDFIEHYDEVENQFWGTAP